MILLKSTSDRTAMWHSLPTEKLVDMRLIHERIDAPHRVTHPAKMDGPILATVSVTQVRICYRAARRDLGATLRDARASLYAPQPPRAASAFLEMRPFRAQPPPMGLNSRQHP